MSPVRGIPTSRAYWELKAEQVLNRVFEPEKPIEVEVCDTPAAISNAGSIPVELHDLPPPPAKQPTSKPKQASAKRRPPRAGSALQRLADQVGRQPSLLLAGASVTVMVVAGMALAVLGLWNQSQQAIRQERNMLLIERLRTMGPGTTPAQANEPTQAAAAVGAGEDGELLPTASRRTLDGRAGNPASQQLPSSRRTQSAHQQPHHQSGTRCHRLSEHPWGQRLEWCW